MSFQESVLVEINDPVISILGKVIKSRYKKPKAIIYKIK